MRPARALGVASLLAGVVAVGVVLSGDGDGHRVFVVVPDAVNVIAGQPVRVAGATVGRVESLKAAGQGRAARIELRIDEEAWPLTPRDHMQLRWGGTVAYNNRYIELRRGRSGGPAIPEHGTFPASRFSAPVEFDELLGTFPPRVRLGMKAMIDNGGAAFRAAEEPFGRALLSAPPALRQTSAVLEDLEAESADLDVMVRSADRVVEAVKTADPSLGRLVSGTATTFAATASEAAALRDMLRQAPRTLRSTRDSLARAESTLRAVGGLTDRLAPGVRELRRLPAPLSSLLRSLVQVGPDARAALASARRATPDLNPFLVRMTALMPRIGSMSRQSAEQLKCIRPYAPDIAAFFSTWGNRHNNTDGRDRYGRTTLQASPYGNAYTGNSADFIKDNPQLSYAFPAPPGLNANQPWFLPECGAGPDALDPTKDPEARPFDPVSRTPALRRAESGEHP